MRRASVILLAAIVMTASIGAAVNAPIASAARTGDKEAVKALLKDGADVNAPEGDGMTALHWAAERGDAELAATLLYAGANIGAQTRIGLYTPLHIAAKGGNAAVVKALLAAHADVAAKSSPSGVTALHLAAASGNVETLNVLLDRRPSGDPCNPPPIAADPPVKINFTTGHKQGGIMDLNANAGDVFAFDLTGVPFDCTSFLLTSEAGGATIVGVSPKIGRVEASNSYGRTGEHIPRGLFVVTGPGVPAASRAEPVSVMDFHPTICHMLGLSKTDVDGEVIEELAGVTIERRSQRASC